MKLKILFICKIFFFDLSLSVKNKLKVIYLHVYRKEKTEFAFCIQRKQCYNECVCENWKMIMRVSAHLRNFYKVHDKFTLAAQKNQNIHFVHVFVC